MLGRGGWSRHSTAIGFGALIGIIVAFGLVETFQPFGFRFRDFTGGMVTFDTLIRIGILTIVVVGLNLLMGYAGQISLGQAAFYGIGAYVSAIMSTMVSRHDLLPGIADTWWWPWLAIVVAMLVTGGFAYVIGRPILRLRGNYLAMATLGLGVVMYTFFREGKDITGGHDGLAGIPRLSIGDAFAFWPVERYYWLVWAVAIVVIIVGFNVINSRVGRGLRAIHTSEVAANTMGVDTDKYRVQVLVLSAMMASVAGSLYAHFQAIVSPGPFGFVASVELVCMSAVGGMASVWGAALGVSFFFVIKEVLRARMHQLLRGAGGEHELIAYGIILILVMIFVPEGLSVGGVRAFDWLRDRLGPGNRGEKGVEAQAGQAG
jgi:branched-chain amino acid transport system permease protein